MSKIESVSITGLMTISYNRRVIPLTNVTWITANEFHMRFEQRSDEIDQTDEFKYEVIKHTPDNLFVQLYFSEPLDVSQGVELDLVHVDMMRKLFMVEDLNGVYSEWKEGDTIQENNVDVGAIRKGRNWGNFGNLTVYQPLSHTVPKQVADSEQAAEIFETVRIVGISL